jgi:hypothetical protein
MALDLNVITPFVGLMGVIIGAVISQYFNHKLGSKTVRADIFFKKKLEYFEKIAETIEKNIRIYKNSILSIKEAKDKAEVKEIIKVLKKDRENFLIKASPLYFNIKNFSGSIIDFVEAEKAIFEKIENIDKTKKISDKREIEVLIQRLDKLKYHGSLIISKMKKELKR